MCAPGAHRLGLSCRWLRLRLRLLLWRAEGSRPQLQGEQRVAHDLKQEARQHNHLRSRAARRSVHLLA